VTHIHGPGRLPRRLLQLTAFLVAALVLGAKSSGAEERALPSDLAQVPPDSGVFFTFRLGDLAAGKVGKQLLAQLRQHKENLAAALEGQLGVPLADVERLTVLPAEDVWVVRTARPYDREKLLDALAPKAERRKHEDRTYYHDEASGTDVSLVDDRVFLLARSRGPKRGLLRLWERPPSKDKALGEALALAAGKHDFVAGLTPSLLVEYFAIGYNDDGQDRGAPPATEQKPRNLPPEALPYKPLFQARRATLVGDLGDEAKVELRLSFPDKEIARDGETALRTALYVLRELLARAPEELGVAPEKARSVGAVLGRMQAALKAATVTRENAAVSAAARVDVEGSIVATLAQQLIDAGLGRRVENNLKQLVLGIVNYADTNGGKVPAGVFDKAGKPLLSWRVAILPYIEQDALYKEFRLDEPWDSEHNKKLVARMPKVFAGLNARLNEQGKTLLLAPSGAGTAWPGGPDKMRYPASFPDGTSNTILLVLADDARAVEWTKPDDLKYDPKDPHAGLAQLAGRFVFGMADGSVHTTRATISKETLRYAFDPADGLPLGNDW
jgi:hypothetical protein